MIDPILLASVIMAIVCACLDYKSTCLLRSLASEQVTIMEINPAVGNAGWKPRAFLLYAIHIELIFILGFYCLPLGTLFAGFTIGKALVSAVYNIIQYLEIQKHKAEIVAKKVADALAATGGEIYGGNECRSCGVSLKQFPAMYPNQDCPTKEEIEAEKRGERTRWTEYREKDKEGIGDGSGREAEGSNIQVREKDGQAPGNQDNDKAQP